MSFIGLRHLNSLLKKNGGAATTLFKITPWSSRAINSCSTDCTSYLRHRILPQQKDYRTICIKDLKILLVPEITLFIKPQPEGALINNRQPKITVFLSFPLILIAINLFNRKHKNMFPTRKPASRIKPKIPQIVPGEMARIIWSWIALRIIIINYSMVLHKFTK